MVEKQARRPDEGAPQQAFQPNIVRDTLAPPQATEADRIVRVYSTVQRTDHALVQLGNLSDHVRRKMEGGPRDGGLKGPRPARTSAQMDAAAQQARQLAEQLRSTSLEESRERHEDELEEADALIETAREKLDENDAEGAEAALSEAEDRLEKLKKLMGIESEIITSGLGAVLGPEALDTLLDNIGAAIGDLGTANDERGKAALEAAETLAHNAPALALDNDKANQIRTGLVNLLNKLGIAARAGQEYTAEQERDDRTELRQLNSAVTEYVRNLSQGYLEQLNRLAADLQARMAFFAQQDFARQHIKGIMDEISRLVERIGGQREGEIDAREARRLGERFVDLSRRAAAILPQGEEAQAADARGRSESLRGSGPESEGRRARMGTPEWFGEQARDALENGNRELARLANMMGSLERAANAIGIKSQDIIPQDLYRGIMGLIGEKASGEPVMDAFRRLEDAMDRRFGMTAGRVAERVSQGIAGLRGILAPLLSPPQGSVEERFAEPAGQAAQSVEQASEALRRGDGKAAVGLLRQADQQVRRINGFLEKARALISSNAPPQAVAATEAAAQMPESERARSDLIMRAVDFFLENRERLESPRNQGILTGLLGFLERLTGTESSALDLEQEGMALDSMAQGLQESERGEVEAGRAFIESAVLGPLVPMLRNSALREIHGELGELIGDAEEFLARYSADPGSVTADEADSLRRRIEQAWAMSERMTQTQSRTLRGQLGRVFASALALLRIGGQDERFGLAMLASDELSAHSEEYTRQERIDLAESAEGLAFGEDEAGRAESARNIASIAANRLASALRNVQLEEHDPETRMQLGAMAERMESAAETGEGYSEVLFAAAKLAAEISGGFQERANPELVAQDAILAARAIYRRAMGLLGQEGYDETAVRAQAALATAVLFCPASMREGIERLSASLADDSTAFSQVSRFLQLEGRREELAAALGGEMPNDMRAALSMSLEALSASIETFLATGSLAPEELIQSEMGRMEAMLSPPPGLEPGVLESIGLQAAEYAAMFAPAFGIEYNPEIGGAEQLRIMIQALEQQGATHEQALRLFASFTAGLIAEDNVSRIFNAAGAMADSLSIPEERRADSSRIYLLAARALSGPDPALAETYLAAAALCAETASANDRAIILRACGECDASLSGMDAARLAAILQIQQARLSVPEISEREQRVNADAYFDLAMLAARNGDSDGAAAALQLASAYANWAAVDEGELTREAREERASEMRSIEERLGDYSRRREMRRGARIGNIGSGEGHEAPSVDTLTAPIAAAIATGHKVAEAFGGATAQENIDSLVELRRQAGMFALHSQSASFGLRIEDSLQLEEHADRYAREAERMSSRAARAEREGDPEFAAYYQRQAGFADIGFATGSRDRAVELFTQGQGLMEESIGLDAQALQARAGGDAALADDFARQAQEKAAEGRMLIQAADMALAGLAELDVSIRRVNTRQRQNGRFELVTGIRTALATAEGMRVDSAGLPLDATAKAEGVEIPVLSEEERMRQFEQARQGIQSGTMQVEGQRGLQRARDRMLRMAEEDLHEDNMVRARELMGSMIDGLCEPDLWVLGGVLDSVPATIEEAKAQIRAKMEQAFEQRDFEALAALYEAVYGISGARGEAQLVEARLEAPAYDMRANELGYQRTVDLAWAENLEGANRQYAETRTAMIQGRAVTFTAIRASEDRRANDETFRNAELAYEELRRQIGAIGNGEMVGFDPTDEERDCTPEIVEAHIRRLPEEVQQGFMDRLQSIPVGYRDGDDARRGLLAEVLRVEVPDPQTLRVETLAGRMADGLMFFDIDAFREWHDSVDSSIDAGNYEVAEAGIRSMDSSRVDRFRAESEIITATQRTYAMWEACREGNGILTRNPDSVYRPEGATTMEVPIVADWTWVRPGGVAMPEFREFAPGERREDTMDSRRPSRFAGFSKRAISVGGGETQGERSRRDARNREMMEAAGALSDSYGASAADFAGSATLHYRAGIEILADPESDTMPQMAAMWDEALAGTEEQRRIGRAFARMNMQAAQTQLTLADSGRFERSQTELYGFTPEDHRRYADTRLGLAIAILDPQNINLSEELLTSNREVEYRGRTIRFSSDFVQVGIAEMNGMRAYIDSDIQDDQTLQRSMSEVAMAQASAQLATLGVGMHIEMRRVYQKHRRTIPTLPHIGFTAIEVTGENREVLEDVVRQTSLLRSNFENAIYGHDSAWGDEGQLAYITRTGERMGALREAIGCLGRHDDHIGLSMATYLYDRSEPLREINGEWRDFDQRTADALEDMREWAGWYRIATAAGEFALATGGVVLAPATGGASLSLTIGVSGLGVYRGFELLERDQELTWDSGFQIGMGFAGMVLAPTGLILSGESSIFMGARAMERISSPGTMAVAQTWRAAGVRLLAGAGGELEGIVQAPRILEAGVHVLGMTMMAGGALEFGRQVPMMLDAIERGDMSWAEAAFQGFQALVQPMAQYGFARWSMGQAARTGVVRPRSMGRQIFDAVILGNPFDAPGIAAHAGIADVTARAREALPAEAGASYDSFMAERRIILPAEQEAAVLTAYRAECDSARSAGTEIPTFERFSQGTPHVYEARFQTYLERAGGIRDLTDLTAPERRYVEARLSGRTAEEAHVIASAEAPRPPALSLPLAETQSGTTMMIGDTGVTYSEAQLDASREMITYANMLIALPESERAAHMFLIPEDILPQVLEMSRDPYFRRAADALRSGQPGGDAVRTGAFDQAVIALEYSGRTERLQSDPEALAASFRTEALALIQRFDQGSATAEQVLGIAAERRQHALRLETEARAALEANRALREGGLTPEREARLAESDARANASLGRAAAIRQSAYMLEHAVETAPPQAGQSRSSRVADADAQALLSREAIARHIIEAEGYGGLPPDYIVAGDATRTGGVEMSAGQVIRSIEGTIVTEALHGRDSDVIIISADKRRLNQINDIFGMENGDRALEAYREILQRAIAQDGVTALIRPSPRGDEVIGIIRVDAGRGAEVRAAIAGRLQAATEQVFAEYMMPAHERSVSALAGSLESPSGIVAASLEVSPPIEVRGSDGAVTARYQGGGDAFITRADGTREFLAPSVTRVDDPPFAAEIRERLGVVEQPDIVRGLEQAEIPRIRELIAKAGRGEILTSEETRALARLDEISAQRGGDRERAIGDFAHERAELQGTQSIPADSMGIEIRLAMPEPALGELRGHLVETNKGLAEILENSFGFRGLNTFLGHYGANRVISAVEAAVASFATEHGLTIRRLGTMKYIIEGGSTESVAALQAHIDAALAGTGMGLTVSRSHEPSLIPAGTPVPEALAHVSNGHVVDRRRPKTDWDGQRALYANANAAISAMALGNEAALRRIFGDADFETLRPIREIIQDNPAIRNFEDLVQALRDSGIGGPNGTELEGLFREYITSTESTLQAAFDREFPGRGGERAAPPPTPAGRLHEHGRRAARRIRTGRRRGVLAVMPDGTIVERHVPSRYERMQRRQAREEAAGRPAPEAAAQGRGRFRAEDFERSPDGRWLERSTGRELPPAISRFLEGGEWTREALVPGAVQDAVQPDGSVLVGQDTLAAMADYGFYLDENGLLVRGSAEDARAALGQMIHLAQGEGRQLNRSIGLDGQEALSRIGLCLDDTGGLVSARPSFAQGTFRYRELMRNEMVWGARELADRGIVEFNGRQIEVDGGPQAAHQVLDEAGFPRLDEVPPRPEARHVVAARSPDGGGPRGINPSDIDAFLADKARQFRSGHEFYGDYAEHAGLVFRRLQEMGISLQMQANPDAGTARIMAEVDRQVAAEILGRRVGLTPGQAAAQAGLPQRPGPQEAEARPAAPAAEAGPLEMRMQELIGRAQRYMDRNIAMVGDVAEFNAHFMRIASEAGIADFSSPEGQAALARARREAARIVIERQDAALLAERPTEPPPAPQAAPQSPAERSMAMLLGPEEAQRLSAAGFHPLTNENGTLRTSMPQGPDGPILVHFVHETHYGRSELSFTLPDPMPAGMQHVYEYRARRSMLDAVIGERVGQLRAGLPSLEGVPDGALRLHVIALEARAGSAEGAMMGSANERAIARQLAGDSAYAEALSRGDVPGALAIARRYSALEAHASASSPVTESGRYVDVVHGARQVIAIGDIHGDAYGLVDQLLRGGVLIDTRPGLNPRDMSVSPAERYRLNPDLPEGTQIVFTGDYLDRGPTSFEAVELVARMRADAQSLGSQVHALRGNHEAIFLRFVDLYRGMSEADVRSILDSPMPMDEASVLCAWRRVGVRDTFESLMRRYGTWENFIAQNLDANGNPEPGSFMEFITGTKAVAIIDNNYFTHGGPVLGPDGNPISTPQALDAYFTQHFSTTENDWAITQIPMEVVVRQMAQGDFSAQYVDSFGWGNRMETPQGEAWMRAMGVDHLYVGHDRGDGVRSSGRHVTNIDVSMSEAYDSGSGYVVIDPLERAMPVRAQESRSAPEATPDFGVPDPAYAPRDITAGRARTEVLRNPLSQAADDVFSGREPPPPPPERGGQEGAPPQGSPPANEPVSRQSGQSGVRVTRIGADDYESSAQRINIETAQLLGTGLRAFQIEVQARVPGLNPADPSFRGAYESGGRRFARFQFGRRGNIIEIDLPEGFAGMAPERLRQHFEDRLATALNEQLGMGAARIEPVSPEFARTYEAHLRPGRQQGPEFTLSDQSFTRAEFDDALLLIRDLHEVHGGAPIARVPAVRRGIVERYLADPDFVRMMESGSTINELYLALAARPTLQEASRLLGLGRRSAEPLDALALKIAQDHAWDRGVGEPDAYDCCYAALLMAELENDAGSRQILDGASDARRAGNRIEARVQAANGMEFHIRVDAEGARIDMASGDNMPSGTEHLSPFLPEYLNAVIGDELTARFRHVSERIARGDFDGAIGLMSRPPGETARALRFAAGEAPQDAMDALFAQFARREIESRGVAEGDAEAVRAASLEAYSRLKEDAWRLIEAARAGQMDEMQENLYEIAGARAANRGRTELTPEDFIFSELVLSLAGSDNLSYINAAIGGAAPAGAFRDVEGFIATSIAICGRFERASAGMGYDSWQVRQARINVFRLAAALHQRGVSDPASVFINPDPAGNPKSAGLLDLFPPTSNEESFLYISEAANFMNSLINAVPEGQFRLSRTVGRRTFSVEISGETALRALLDYAADDARRIPDAMGRTEYLDMLADSVAAPQDARRIAERLGAALGDVLITDRGEAGALRLTDRRTPLAAFTISGPEGLTLSEFLGSRQARRHIGRNVNFRAAIELTQSIGRARRRIQELSNGRGPEIEAHIAARREWLAAVDALIRRLPQDAADDVMGRVMPKLSEILRQLDNNTITASQFSEICRTLGSAETVDAFLSAYGTWFNRTFASELGLPDGFVSDNVRLVLDFNRYRDILGQLRSDGPRPGQDELIFAGNPRLAGLNPHASQERPAAFDESIPVIDAAIQARAQGPEAFRDFKFSEDFHSELAERYPGMLPDGRAQGEALFGLWREEGTGPAISFEGREFTLTESGSFENMFYNARMRGQESCQDPMNMNFVVSGLAGTIELPWIKQIIIRSPDSPDIRFRRMVVLVAGEDGPVLLVQPEYHDLGDSSVGPMDAAIMEYLRARYEPLGVEVRDISHEAFESGQLGNTGYGTFRSGRAPFFYLDSNLYSFMTGPHMVGRNGLHTRTPGEPVSFPEGWDGTFNLDNMH